MFIVVLSAGLNPAHASLNTGLVHFDGCFHFLLLFAIGLLRFLHPILDPLAFVPDTFYTHNLLNMAFPKTFLNMAFSKTLVYTHAFDLNLKCGLNKTNGFASKPSFPQRAVLHKNRAIHKHIQTLCFTQKPCSCWACASAVCGLLDSHFHGGRRTTPKAAKLDPVSIETHADLGVPP